MKTKTHLKAGGISVNHNETLVRDAVQGPGLQVKTRVRAGGISVNHNETLVRDGARKNRPA
jgi:hypothetical protein